MKLRAIWGHRNGDCGPNPLSSPNPKKSSDSGLSALTWNSRRVCLLLMLLLALVVLISLVIYKGSDCTHIVFTASGELAS